MKIIILGAGASIGNNLKSKNLPPSVYDFFKGNIFDELKGPYKALFNYLDKNNFNYKVLSDMNVEDLFSKIESFWKMNIGGKFDREYIVNNYDQEVAIVNPLDFLISYVIDYILMSTKDILNMTCSYHDYIVNKIIEPDDIIFSFNYDLLMDYSLKKSNKLLWSEWDGYGIIPYNHYDHDRSDKSHIKLLKLHGSLNFFKRKRSSKRPGYEEYIEEEHIEIVPIENIGKDYSGPIKSIPNLAAPELSESFIEISNKFPKGYKKFELGYMDKDIFDTGYISLIIYPTLNKPFEYITYGEMRSIWNLALKKMCKADEILAIGFSFNDQHFNQLFEMALAQNINTVKLTIVNSKEEKESIIEKFSHLNNLKINNFTGFLDKFIKYYKLL